ncbi:MAG: hypothetical protein JW881_17035 [Spirochaetales bacterium]|nr:hypothetical protein [Spirochaetales bacterium]
MKKRSPLRKTGELLVFSAIVVIANLFFKNDPGFFREFFLPYLALSLLSASYYGKFYGFLSLCISSLFVALPLPFLLKLVYQESFPLSIDLWIDLGERAMFPVSITFCGAFFLGMLRDSMTAKQDKLKNTIQKISRDKGLLLRETKALKAVNHELEKRLSTQKDSIISLYLRIQGLYTLSLKNSLGVIINTIQRFTGATSCSIWEYMQEYKKLILRLSAGWDVTKNSLTVIPVENTIEGWVVRNNMLFSAKILLQYENLKHMDTGRNVYTAPIFAGHKIWGVLNVEEIPFEKFNLYTEKILLMILALVAPALERAIEYESFTVEEALNPITKLPPFSQFYVFLEKELGRMIMEKGTLSVVIIEMIKYTELFGEFDREEVLHLIAMLIEDIKRLSENKALFFHYKSNNQLCFIYPNLDYDGCSLFCLDILELLNEKEYEINDKKARIEAILGYASLGEKEQNANDLLNVAENLLEMQKI